MRQLEKTYIHYAHDETGWKITLADTGEKTLKSGRLDEKFICLECYKSYSIDSKEHIMSIKIS